MHTSNRRATPRTNRAGSANRVFTAAIAAALGFAGTARADLWWDSDGVTGGGSSTTTADGLWNGNLWSNSSGGTAATGGWIAGETAVFSAGTDVSGASIITLDTNQAAGGIRFEEGTVTLSGVGGLTFGATVSAPVIQIGNTTGNRTANINVSLTAANQLSFTRGNSGLNTIVNLGAANTFSSGLLIGELVRVNANIAGALGSSAVTINGNEASISTITDNTAFEFTNDFVLNPLGLANFSTGFGAGGTAGVVGTPGTIANFSGDIVEGNAGGISNVIITPTANVNNVATNGNGITIFSGNNTYK